MAFRAVHGQWGAVFAHLPDLGCGRAWESVWKVRRPTPLTCDECGHAMYAKVSPHGLRFFAHAPGAPNCALAGESIAHHLLKLELASAARDAGAHAELEVRGPSGTWRADVLATALDGRRHIALEAQLAPITSAEITARTEAMRADGVGACWFSDRPRPPWLGVVPSVRLEHSDGAKPLVVAEGLARFASAGWKTVPAMLADFLAWVLAGRVVPHAPRTGPHYPPRRLAVVWTAPRYIRAEAEHLAEAERQRRSQEARPAAERSLAGQRRAEILARNAASRAKALQEATAAELTARGKPVFAQQRERALQRPEVRGAIALLAQQYGATAAVGWSTGDPRYGGGTVLVDAGGVPVAVFGPKPGQVRDEAFLLLAGLLLLFPTKHAALLFEFAVQRMRRWPADGFRTDFVEGRATSLAPRPEAADLGSGLSPSKTDSTSRVR